MPYNAKLQFEGIVEFSDGGFSFTHPPPTHAHTRTHTRMHTHMHTHTHTHARTHSFCGQYWKGKKERKRMQENRKQEVENIRNFQITVNYCNY